MKRWRHAPALVAAVAAVLLGAAPAHAARMWQDPIQVADDAQPLEGTDMAVTATGDDVVAWRDDSDGKYTIAARAVSAAGVPGDSVVLGGGYNTPSVAALGTDAALVAWVGSTTPGEPGDSVLVSEWHRGQGFSEPREVAQGSRYVQPGTVAAANLPGDAVVLYSTGNSDGLQSVRRTRDGDWLEPHDIDIDPGSVWEINAGMSETGEASYAMFLNHWENGGEQVYTASEPPDGPPTKARRLAAAGDHGSDPSLAVNALGFAVVTWIETGPDSDYAGDVRAAVKPPSGQFGPAIDIGGSAPAWDGAPVALSADGHALVAWEEERPSGQSGGLGYGIWASAGLAETGTFLPPEDISEGLASGPPKLAADPVGNALIFFEDWDTFEPRVVRRSVSGLLGQARNPVSCPRRYVWQSDAYVDPAGNATLLWKNDEFLLAKWPLFVSRDAPSTTFGPDPCPAPPPWLTWGPKDPEPGQEVTFDGSGANDPKAAKVTFEWDLDGDGEFETDTGQTPTVKHTFAEAGEHQIGFRVYQESQRTGNGAGSTCVYTVRVGMPPEPPVDPGPDPWGWDPRPPDSPDEDPWPVGPRDLPPTDPVPPGGGVDLPPLPGVPHPPPLPPGIARASGAKPTLAVSAPSRIRLRALVKHGLPVSLLSSSRGRARLRLSASGGVAAGKALVRVGDQRSSVAIRLTQRARKLLARRHSTRLTLTSRLLSGGSLPVRQLIRVRR